MGREGAVGGGPAFTSCTLFLAMLLSVAVAEEGIQCSHKGDCIDCKVVLNELLVDPEFMRVVDYAASVHPAMQETHQYLRILQEVYTLRVHDERILPQHVIESFLAHSNHSAVDERCVALFKNIKESALASGSLKVWRKLLRVTLFLNSLLTNLEQPRQRNLKESARSSDVKVVVVGAGPVGLLSALQAYTACASIVAVYEKRLNYSRDIWFDLYAMPFSRALVVLRRLGFDALSPYIQHINSAPKDQIHVITIRASTLERFLSKVAAIVGIELHYGHEYITHCSGEEGKPLAVFWEIGASPPLAPTCETLRENNCPTSSFDLLIAADGASSVTRKDFDVAFPPQESFLLSPKMNVTVPKLHQATLLINFRPKTGVDKPQCIDDYTPALEDTTPTTTALSSGDLGACCPQVRRDVGYDYPGFVVSGVTAVFRRFYYSHCQMQILFSNQLGADLLGTYSHYRNLHHSHPQQDSTEDNIGKNEEIVSWQDEGIPWEKVKEIVNVMFMKPFRQVKPMKNQILTRQESNERRNEESVHNKGGSGGVDTEEYDVDLFPVIISRAEKTALLVSSKTEEGKGGEKSAGIVAFVGDASVTAHFRLGVGINNAFSSLVEIEEMVKGLRDLAKKNGEPASEDADVIKKDDEWMKKMQGIVERREAAARARIDQMVQFQVSTMFFESYCDYGVLFDQKAKDIYSAQEVYRKHRDRRDYYPYKLKLQDIIQHCPLLSASSFAKS